ncbi:MAG: endonuclease [Candidatus Azobacteroides sp.]|nr:endonuclease [Candidatus Azobacteroides sp.]
MFYNVENLFDTINAPDKADDEFTPEGFRHWTPKRYYRKINHLAKVITSIGGWDTPALIGLCEVENDKVINDLIFRSPLRKMQYRYLITESDDPRGLNVALLYQRNQFKYLYHDCIRLIFSKNQQKKTRDILHVTGIVITGDTLDVFVCHFPSRRGGQSESEPDRIEAASVVLSEVDRLTAQRSRPNILIMGDFNDEPSNKSMLQILHARPLTETNDRNELYNLFLVIEEKSIVGSYKFGDRWNFLDQIIVSGDLLNPANDLHVLPETATIFHKEFLSTEDRTYGGIRPKKTFHGHKYEGGFSDHFPIVVQIATKRDP